MADHLEYILNDDFPLKWRFAEDATKWTVLPDEDMKHFRPLSVATSKTLWMRHFNYTWGRQELKEQEEQFWENRTAELYVKDDWSEGEEIQRVSEFLCASLDLPKESPVLFFWDHECAVETTWDILLRYWPDFCYPSDRDNVAIPLDSQKLICFIEGMIFLTPRLVAHHSTEG